MAQVLGRIPSVPDGPTAPAGHHADDAKATTVRSGDTPGARVNPWHNNGGMVPNRYPPELDKWWSVESGTHA